MATLLAFIGAAILFALIALRHQLSWIQKAAIAVILVAMLLSTKPDCHPTWIPNIAPLGLSEGFLFGMLVALWGCASHWQRQKIRQ